MMALGAKNKIPALLAQRGWTMYRLQKETGMTYATIHQIATSETIPPRTYWESIKKIAAAFGVSESELEQ